MAVSASVFIIPEGERVRTIWTDSCGKYVGLLTYGNGSVMHIFEGDACYWLPPVSNVVCRDCGANLSEVSFYEDDGGYLCESCAYERYQSDFLGIPDVCEDCGLEGEIMASPDGTYVCAECLSYYEMDGHYDTSISGYYADTAVLPKFFVRATVEYITPRGLISEEVTRCYFYSVPTLDAAHAAFRQEFRRCVNITILESGEM